MENWKEIIRSPIWFIPVGLFLVLASIEGIHLSKHSQYCKTKAEWMNESGEIYERESEVN